MKPRHSIVVLTLPSWSALLIATTSAVIGQGFHENAIAWQEDVTLRDEGLLAADKFRLKLLGGTSEDGASAETLGTALHEFRTRYHKPLPDRPSLERFAVTKAKFVKQLRGTEKVTPTAAFGLFAGRWYGRWDKLDVDHHWHDVISLDARGASTGREADDRPPLVIAQQYAWIGNGFGWNYLVRVAESGDVVLGYVCLIDPKKEDAIRFRAPLVGYFDGPGRLIWVTPTSVYFEEVLATSAAPERYAITGFNYSMRGGVLNAQDPAFQAVYTRHSTERPEWLKFPISLTVSSAARN